MRASPTSLALLTLATLTACLLALLVAVGTGLLARWDGASTPAALLRAGAAFGATLTVATALLALTIDALT